MPFNLETLTSPESVIRTGLPQVISAMVKNLLLISTTNLSPYLILEGVEGNNSNSTHQFNTTSVAWFGYLNMAIVPIGGIVSGFVTNAIGTKFSLQGALGILIFLRLISLFFKEAWNFYLVVILTNFCSEFFKGPVFTHLAESAEPHLRTTLSASASSSMIFGQFQQLLMSTFLNPKVTTYINCALPGICIFLLIIVPETPHALMVKNKFEEARKSLAWYRGWVKIELIEPEYQKLLAYHKEEELKKKAEEEEEEQKQKQGQQEKNESKESNSDEEQPSTSSTLNSITSKSSSLNLFKSTIEGESGRLAVFKNITKKEKNKESGDTDVAHSNEEEPSTSSTLTSIKSKTSRLNIFKGTIEGESVLKNLTKEKNETKESDVTDVSNSDAKEPPTSSTLNSIKSKTSRLNIFKGTMDGESSSLPVLKNLTKEENKENKESDVTDVSNSDAKKPPRSSTLNSIKNKSSRLNIFKGTIDGESSSLPVLKNLTKKENKESDVSDVSNSDAEESSTSSTLKSSRLNILKGTAEDASGRLAGLKNITNSGPLNAFKNVTSGATNQLGSIKGAVTSESSLLGTVKDKVPIHLLEEGFNTVKNAKVFARQSFVLPLALVTFTHFLVYFTGTTVLLSQPEKILNSLHSPLNPRYAAVVLSGANVVGSFISVMVIKKCGKRLIVFISLIGMTVCSVAVSLYAYLTIVDYHGNNHNVTESIPLATIPTWNAYNWIPLVILFVLCIISNFGLCNLPWVLVGELFSKNTRAVGTGIVSGITSLLDSFCNSSLGTLLNILGFSGLYGFYAGVSAAGAIILHFVLPETEGKTLEEIEKHFDELPFYNNTIISRYFNVFISKFRKVNIKCLESSTTKQEKEELNSEKNKNSTIKNYCSF